MPELTLEEYFLVKAAQNMGATSNNPNVCKAYIDSELPFDQAVPGWQQMSMSTAQGAAALDNAYLGASYDGRYVYYAPRNSDTFVRYDTTLDFTNSSAWSRISMSTAQGAAALDGAYIGASYDGRYVYYVPLNSDTFIRFDTTLDFTNSSAWSRISMSTAQGGAELDWAYVGASYDGRYVYYVPLYSDTFVRLDTTLDFTNSSAWSRMNMSTAQGAAALDDAYAGVSYDGRYVYYAPAYSDTFVRFDTTLDFTNSSAWSRMSMSTAQGGAAVDAAYVGASYDGRYVYYAPAYSDTFVRFDTTLDFTHSSAWSRMSMSTAQGGAALDTAYYGASYDGRYIYYAPRNSDTFIRFDTTLDFTNSSAWSRISMSTAQGADAVDNAYAGAPYDGRYVYYVPLNSDTFVRVLATYTKNSFPGGI